MNALSYLFYPNPANAHYTSPKALVLLCVCTLMVIGSFALKHWRGRLTNPVTKKLSRSWSSVLFWYGLVGLFLAVSRVEEISYVSMRIWWVVWLGCLLVYSVFQVRKWRAKHYEVVPQEEVADARDKYLPKKKKR